jgi:glycine cleavage system transcriptional repressor
VRAMSELVVTAVGPDRVGIAADVSRRISENGGSIASSRMVNLHGQFALLALVEGPQSALDRVREALLAAAPDLGLRIDSTAGGGAARSGAPSIPYRLKSYSVDRPGIVHQVTELLRRHGVNVEELETRVESAPFAGTPLFLMEAVLSVPAGVPARTLRQELAELGAAIGCDLDLDPA